MDVSNQTLTIEQDQLLRNFFKEQAERATELGEGPLLRRIAVPSPQGGYTMETRHVTLESTPDLL